MERGAEEGEKSGEREWRARAESASGERERNERTRVRARAGSTLVNLQK